MSLTSRARSLTVFAFLFAIGVCARTLSAQSRGSAPPRIPVQALAEARTRGTTRVIVGLNIGFTPEPVLDAAAVSIQRASIAQAQINVLGRVARVNPSSVRRFTYIPFLAVEVDEADLVNLAASPDVSSIELDAVVGPALAESTPLVGATKAWAAGFTGSGWTVAVLDTGIDSTHPFLSGKVISEACYSSTIAGRSNSFCPGGVTSSTAPGSAVPCSLAACNHGTHVAGIAAGKGVSFSGVARDASLVSVQVFSSFLTSADCGSRPTPCALSFFSDQVLGLERVYALRSTYNIAAVNISIGGGGFTSPCDATLPSMKSIIDQLRAANIATVIASGNDGFVDALGAPACVSSAVSVASTTDGSSTFSGQPVPPDQVSNFSNTNQYLSLFAPGETILSSVPNGGFALFNGTSMAAPHVAGAWAVMKSRAASATVSEVLNALTSTGTPILDPGNGITKPRINVDLALQVFPTPCTYTVNPTHFDVGPENGAVFVTVNTQPNCPWTATTLSAFIPVPSGVSGRGSGTVTIIHQVNLTRFARDGAVLVAGNTITLSQRRRVGQSDMNLDGRADLLWQNVADGGLATWYLDGWNVRSTTFLGISRVADLNWRVVGSGDLDGDGFTDLVWQHQTEGWLAVWYLGGNATVRSTVFLSINRVEDLNWQIRGVDDIDGDGKADLIWQNQADGRLAAWLMDGSQVRDTRFLSIPQVADTDWQIVGAGDANGDGYADLVWQHRTQGWLAVWFMRGTNVLSTGFLSFNRITDMNWHIRGVGDVDADNFADLIWQNDATGELGVWTLNGSVVVSQRALSIDRVSDLNWRIVGPG